MPFVFSCCKGVTLLLRCSHREYMTWWSYRNRCQWWLLLWPPLWECGLEKCLTLETHRNSLHALSLRVEAQPLLLQLLLPQPFGPSSPLIHGSLSILFTSLYCYASSPDDSSGSSKCPVWRSSVVGLDLCITGSQNALLHPTTPLTCPTSIS